MWTVLNLNGDPLYWHSTWDAAVTWAMKRGGDLDVLFQPYFRSEGSLIIEGDIDIHGDMVVFRAGGPSVPLDPWPQKFYVSHSIVRDLDVMEVRPLTVMGLVKGVGMNFVTMNLWRFLWTLRCLGFLSTPEGGRYHRSQWTFRFWRHHQVWRFRVVRWWRRRFAH